VVRRRPLRAPVVVMVRTGIPPVRPVSVTWPWLIRSTNLSIFGKDLANSRAPGRDDEMGHIAR
jgi:hypothetical protein